MRNMDRARLLCVTVISNHRDRLAALLRSLQDQTYEIDGIIAIDAASRDGTTSWIAQNHPHVSVLRLFHYQGMTHAWRQGIRFALQRVKPEDRTTTWVLCVSPETLLAKDACEQLLESVQGLPDVGAVGPVILQAWKTGADEEALAEIELTQQLVAIGTGLRRSFQWMYRHAGQGFTPSLISSPTEVLSVPSLCVLLRADVLEGMIDQRKAFENAYEETEPLFLDAGMRLRSLGKLGYVIPNALAWKVDYRGAAIGRERWALLLRRERDRVRIVRAAKRGWLGAQTIPWRFLAWITAVPFRFWMWITRDAAGRSSGCGPSTPILPWNLNESLGRWLKS